MKPKQIDKRISHNFKYFCVARAPQTGSKANVELADTSAASDTEKVSVLIKVLRDSNGRAKEKHGQRVLTSSLQEKKKKRNKYLKRHSASLITREIRSTVKANLLFMHFDWHILNRNGEAGKLTLSVV